ncbi:TlpA disulfide reductase family protein [Nocardioides jensenii]|uniref:TlpA disulfide reductase family protein n=1 Tax=Nocardioides jensenii TaxID=1843 RepID=UPI00082B5953|nr:TlpA disulfide reductase family protein [Nocardioides jensenii]
MSGNGQVTELDPGERTSPIRLSGEDLDGKPISLEDYRGKVVVVNVWGAWCVECRKEAPEVVEVAKAADPDDVVFVGLNNRDPSRDNAMGFVRTYDVPYRSIFDPTAKTLLAFHGTLTPYSTPSTVIIDRKGRVAASILGVLPSKTTLETLIDEVVAEDA